MMGSIFGAAIRIAYDAEERPFLIGETASRNQNKVSSPVWRIKKIVYDGISTRIVAILWAEGSFEFNFRWDARETYNY